MIIIQSLILAPFSINKNSHLISHIAVIVQYNTIQYKQSLEAVVEQGSYHNCTLCYECLIPLLMG